MHHFHGCLDNSSWNVEIGLWTLLSWFWMLSGLNITSASFAAISRRTASLTSRNVIPGSVELSAVDSEGVGFCAECVWVIIVNEGR